MKCTRSPYSLEGLPYEGVCPECGLPIWKSARPPAQPWITATCSGRVLLGVFFGGWAEFAGAYVGSVWLDGPVVYIPRPMPIDLILWRGGGLCFAFVAIGASLWLSLVRGPPVPCGAGAFLLIAWGIVLLCLLASVTTSGEAS